MPAMILVFVGTFGATLAACGMDAMKKIPAFYKIAFAGAEHHLAGKVHELVGFAEQARKDGLLALESDLEEIDDAFTKKGMQLVVDGTDPDLVREILEVEVDAMAARHKEGAEVFKTAGGFAPTMGIIGTVMGLVHVLQQPERARDPRPVDLRRLHRHPHGRRRGQRRLPARRQPPEGPVARGARTCATWSSRASSPSRPATTRASSPRS